MTEADVEVDDQLVRLLYGDKELDVEYEAYLSELTSYPLDRIEREPKRLGDQCQAVQKAMEQLAYENYRSFVQTGDCVRELYGSVSAVAGNLAGLRKGLSGLAEAAKAFRHATEHVEDQWAMTGGALEQHQRLLELLEVPQLMETCVRNGYYEEALQLQQFANQLLRKHPDISAIANIASEVRHAADVMLEQLHEQLRGNIQVTACLRVIGFLRRLEVYSEAQLRVSFLKCRDQWLASEAEKIPRQNAYTYLNKLVDLTRGSLFDIITQYRAIFADGRSAGRETAILHSWLVAKVQLFLTHLHTGLARIADGGSLHNVLDQCMYLGMSLSRVGVDFRGLLPPIFEEHVTSMYSTAIQRATSTFVQATRQVPQTSASRPRPPLLVAERAESFAPSHTLLQYPALALLANDLLSAFNQLRQCAPGTVLEAVAGETQEALSLMVCALKAHRQQAGGQAGEHYAGLARAMAETFVPYVDRCLSHVFHSSVSLLHTDELVADLATMYEEEGRSK